MKSTCFDICDCSRLFKVSSYIGSLFSIRGPRDTTALLDIERAFNKLEKAALKRRRKLGRPLVLIINSTHLLRDDEDGRDLLELIQQRAEQWAASNLVTIGVLYHLHAHHRDANTAFPKTAIHKH